MYKRKIQLCFKDEVQPIHHILFRKENVWGKRAYGCTSYLEKTIMSTSHFLRVLVFK